MKKYCQHLKMLEISKRLQTGDSSILNACCESLHADVCLNLTSISILKQATLSQTQFKWHFSGGFHSGLRLYSVQVSLALITLECLSVLQL